MFTAQKESKKKERIDKPKQVIPGEKERHAPLSTGDPIGGVGWDGRLFSDFSPKAGLLSGAYDSLMQTQDLLVTYY